MSEMIPAVCGKPKVVIPDRECTECEEFERRLSAIEELLSNEIELTMIDEYGDTVIAHVYGWVEATEHIRWSGLDPLYVEVGEEFEPLDGVSAIGCNNTPANVTVEGGGE